MSLASWILLAAAIPSLITSVTFSALSSLQSISHHLFQLLYPLSHHFLKQCEIRQKTLYCTSKCIHNMLYKWFTASTYHYYIPGLQHADQPMEFPDLLWDARRPLLQDRGLSQLSWDILVSKVLLIKTPAAWRSSVSTLTVMQPSNL